MTRTTKDQAKQEVALYGELLMDRGVISEIESEEVRNQIRYSFHVYDPTYTYRVDCSGILELALVLTCMWSAFAKSRSDLGFDF